MEAVVANVLSRLGINPYEIKYSQGNEPVYSTSLAISTRSGKPLGSVGIVAAKELKRFDIKQEVYYCELSWSALVQIAMRHKVSFRPLPRTMAVKRDLALLIDTAVTMQQIETVVRESERRLLRNVTLFDVYEGDKLPQGKKSYAINITLQDDEQTLNDKQIDAVMKKIITNLEKKLGATLR